MLASTRGLRQFSGSDDHPLGISVGIAIFDPQADDSPDDLLARADAAMYETKRAGKGGFTIEKSPGRTLGSHVKESDRSEKAS